MSDDDHFKLTIDRAVWLRGRDSAAGSYLLREIDRKRCCLGIYLSALGVPDDVLEGIASPGYLARECPQVRDLVPNWLIQGSMWNGNFITCSPFAVTMMEVNDDDTADEGEREAQIALCFTDHGVDVTFVGGQ